MSDYATITLFSNTMERIGSEPFVEAEIVYAGPDYLTISFGPYPPYHRADWDRVVEIAGVPVRDRDEVADQFSELTREQRATRAHRQALRDLENL